MRPRILFQGSYSRQRNRKDTPKQLEIATSIAQALGEVLISRGLDLILTGSRSLDVKIGRAAVETCMRLEINPRERIRTHPRWPTRPQIGFHGASPRGRHNSNAGSLSFTDTMER